VKNFKPDSRSRDRRDFGDRDSRRPVLYDAVCDECGKNCQVPFRPSGNKPVYCSDCFEKKGGRDSNRSSRRAPRQRDFGDRATLEKIGTLNTKLDKIIDLLSSVTEKEPESH